MTSAGFAPATLRFYRKKGENGMPLFQVKVYLLENGSVQKRRMKISAKSRDEAERLVSLLFGTSVLKIK